MRGVRFTKAEREWLWDLVDTTAVSSNKADKLRRGILEKLTAAVAPQETGVAAGPIEQALVAESRGKIVALVDSKSYPRVSRQASQHAITPELARLVGAWVASQKWLQGPMTIFTVLNKWPDWLARAKASAPPDGLGEGLGNVGQGAGAQRSAPPTGRRPPGLG